MPHIPLPFKDPTTRYIKTIASICALIAATYSIIFFAFGVPVVAGILLGIAGAFCLPILNCTPQTKPLCRLWTIVLVNLCWAFFSALMGEESNTFVWMIVTMAITFLLYEYKHIKIVLALCTIPLGLFLYLEWVHYTIPFISRFTPDIPELIQLFRITVTLFAYFALIEMLYIFSKSNDIAKRNLKQAIETKNNFCKTVIHDLLNPVTVIQCSIDDIVTKLPKKDQKSELVGNLNTSVEKISNLASELVTTIKIDENQYQPDRRPTNLKDLTSSIVAQQKPHLSSKKLKITITTQVADIVTSTDSSILTHILDNFISNAIKFAYENTQIGITIVETPDAYTISVSDSGVGIKKTELAKLFQSFPNIDNKPIGKPSGSGLGLANCHTLAELIGASLSATSQHKKGSTFSVTWEKNS